MQDCDMSFVFQCPATVSKAIVRVAGWHHGRHAYLSAGHGAGEDGCNAKGNVRLSRTNSASTALAGKHMSIYTLQLNLTYSKLCLLRHV